MATRKSAPRSTTPRKGASDATDAPDSTLNRKADLDVFNSAPPVVAATAGTLNVAAAAEAKERETGSQDLTSSEERMAEAKGAGRATREQLAEMAGRTQDDPPSGPELHDPRSGETSDEAYTDPRGHTGESARAEFESLAETNRQHQGHADTSAVASGTLPSVGGLSRSREDITAGLPPSAFSSSPPSGPDRGIGMISDGAAKAGALGGVLSAPPAAAAAAPVASFWGTAAGGAAAGAGATLGEAAVVAGAAAAAAGVVVAGGLGAAAGAALYAAFEEEFAEAQQAVADLVSGPSAEEEAAFEKAKAEAEARKKAEEEAKAKADEEAKKKAEEDKKEGGGASTPEPDAPDPEKILAWQRYLAQNGLLNNFNPGSIDNKSNPSPEDSGGGGTISRGEAWHLNQSAVTLVGQPAGGPDDPDGTGGCTGGGTPGTNWNDQHNGAVDPSEDQDTGREMGIEEQPEDVQTSPQGDLSHLAPSTDDTDDQPSYLSLRHEDLSAIRHSVWSSSDDDSDE